ncbi:MAG: 2Fe-2S iron-sulfur cluster-binding protein, partial [Candidatus Bathyarchaeota archaeon]|nr:2Fe-2S iron-sulfur cluster-binding protein [Candidatus Bathyarchaeota archaeon]
MAKVVVFPNGVRINASVKDNLLNTLTKAGIEIQSFCGGNGTCGKCKVIIRNGKNALTAISPSERKIISPKELGDKYRLACCCFIKKDDDIEIEIPAESLIEYQKLSITGLEPYVKLDPFIQKKCLKLSRTTL